MRKQLWLAREARDLRHHPRHAEGLTAWHTKWLTARHAERLLARHARDLQSLLMDLDALAVGSDAFEMEALATDWSRDALLWLWLTRRLLLLTRRSMHRRR